MNRVHLIRYAACAACLLLTVFGTGCDTGFTRVHFLSDGDRLRTYEVYLPAGYFPDEERPLVIALHGATQNGRDIRHISGFGDLADRNGFLVAYPDGFAGLWNIGTAAQGSIPVLAGIDDIAFIDALIDDVDGRYGVDPTRVYLAGFSNGGMMAQYYACLRSERVAAVAAVGAALPTRIARDCAADRAVPALVAHGTADQNIPFEGGPVDIGPRSRTEFLSAPQTVAFWVAHNRAAPEPLATPIPDRDPGDRTRTVRFEHPHPGDAGPVVFYKVEGGGHTWPGGLQYLPAAAIGPTARDFELTPDIWAFFQRFRRPEAPNPG